MKVLSVDPGEKRIGLAVSDPTGTIARPLTVLKHTVRLADAAQIAAVVAEQQAELVVVGAPLDAEGRLGPQARKSQRLAEAIRQATEVPVVLWDESLTTVDAARSRCRRRRDDSLDPVAAAVLLQGYLDAH